MKDILVGQILALKIIYDNEGTIADKKHPYLVLVVDNYNGCLTVVQLDSIAGKEYKAFNINTCVISCDGETVIDKDSYATLDTYYRIEYYEELSKYRRQEDKLSKEKLEKVISRYNSYHSKYFIDDNKNVYLSKSEIEKLNSKST